VALPIQPLQLFRRRAQPGSSPTRRATTISLTVIGAVLVGLAIVGFILRFVPFASNPFMSIAAFSLYLMLGAPVALVLLLVARQWATALVAAIVVVLSIVVYAPLYTAQKPPANSKRLAVMTSNLRLGLADAASLVAAVRRHDVEVLMTEELTPEEVSRLQAAGLSSLLPYSALHPAGGGTGTGVWSRYPITDSSQAPGYTFHIVLTRIDVPGVKVEPTFVGAHLAGPVPSAKDWSKDINALPATLKTLAAQNPDGSVIVGGDFNATWDTAQFRKLLRGGYRDAAEQSGSGYTRSYRADVWYGPFIAIDHVLTRNAVATSARTVTIKGSDHRALLTEVAVPTS
jgi:endonuclease/exonuclease/phosphatase (EEP) superfamily protein YafD